MSTRQSRRAAERTHGAGGGPNKRDPMRALYIGFAVAMILVVAVFALFNYKQKRDAAVMYATPTPGANPTAKPTQLVDQSLIGKKVFRDGDMFGGGAGSPVDGIKCETMEQVVVHLHAHLTIFDHGKQIAVPRYIGIVSNGNNPGCLYWVHTHGTEGIIHVEAPELASYTLGNFFHIWGASLSRSDIATLTGPVTAFVNGTKYDGDLAAIPLTAHQQITLEVGTPVVAPPNYALPVGE
ncbi:MAG: hypothetical protein NVS9B12_14930 [Vulcanimicrobiaceae bacterium]